MPESIPEALPAWTTAVDPAWVDYNGHVNDSAYATIAAAANEDLLDRWDLGKDYAARTGHAMYTASLHIDYRHEIRAADEITVARHLERLGGSSLTLTTRMMVAADGGETLCAETETVLVHVGPDGSVPFSPAQRAAIGD